MLAIAEQEAVEILRRDGTHTLAQLCDALRAVGIKDQYARSAVWHLLDLGVIDADGDWNTRLTGYDPYDPKEE